ncbi:hypothetical protein KY347_00670 [Candidatus Woesearchaeota archaeon]|nr:hypothetical protein [Candidatus Woesearchaeota archaeon]
MAIETPADGPSSNTILIKDTKTPIKIYVNPTKPTLEAISRRYEFFNGSVIGHFLENGSIYAVGTTREGLIAVITGVNGISKDQILVYNSGWYDKNIEQIRVTGGVSSPSNLNLVDMTKLDRSSKPENPGEIEQLVKEILFSMGTSFLYRKEKDNLRSCFPVFKRYSMG